MDINFYHLCEENLLAKLNENLLLKSENLTQGELSKLSKLDFKIDGFKIKRAIKISLYQQIDIYKRLSIFS